MMSTREKAIHSAIGTLQRLADLFAERRERLAIEVGLTVSQWRLLEEIAAEHFMPSLFARRRDVSPAAISKGIRRLLDGGLIVVDVAVGDRRQRLYALSAKGKRTLARLRADRQRAIEVLWSDIPMRDLAQFSKFGERLGDRLEGYLRGDGD